MKRPFYIVAMLFVIASVFFLFPKNDAITAKVVTSPASDKSEEVMAQEDSVQQKRMTASVANKEKNVKADKAQSQISEKELKALHKSFPSKNQVAADKKANPHMPSKSLMDLGKKLGPLMEKAYKSESDANKLVNELSVCANEESIDVAARALCVQDTEKLSQYYPELKSKAVDLRSNVSPEVRKILETNDAFIKKKSL